MRAPTPNGGLREHESDIASAAGFRYWAALPSVRAMQTRPLFGALILLLSLPSYADCPLAFAPKDIRERVRQHYFSSTRRDAPPPGDPMAAMAGDGQATREHEKPAGELPRTQNPKDKARTSLGNSSL